MASIDLTTSKIDVASIVENLLYVDAAPVRRLQSQVTTLQSKVTAYQSLNTKISALADKVNTMLYGSTEVPFVEPDTYEERLATSLFSKCGVTSSDESKITATATNATSAGAYAISVTRLAKAESMASSGYADTTSALAGTGTITIATGSGDPVTITIDDAHNTLIGVRDAINDANAGVTATIVNDGSSSNAYRLLLRADGTGTDNAFTVTENLSGGQALGFTQTQAAADAEFTVNGVSITKSSNTVSDVISGVTFTLKNETAGTVTLEVDRDMEAVIEEIKSFVAAYNTASSYINSQFIYDSNKEKAGVLSGDTTLRRIQSNLQNQLTQSVTNPLTQYSVVGQVGIQFNRDGTLALNETKLREALSENYKGVAALLLGDGSASGATKASDSRVSVSGKTSATQTGVYDIAITTLAEQASVTGQPFTAAADGEVLTIATGAGSYTVNLNSSLTIDQVIEAINTEMSGHGVTATNESGAIKITTNEYGSAQSLSVSSSIDGSMGFGTSQVSDTGVDVAGTMDGHAAVGNGRTLTGATGQSEEGLSLLISQTTTGSYGSVTVSSGTSILAGLASALDGITDPLTGPIKNAQDGLNKNIEYLNDSIEAYQDRLDKMEDMYLELYNAADQALKMLDVNQSELSSLINSMKTE